jgi:hypothetical protein
MAQSIFFFNSWNENSFACFVPSLAFAFNGDGCFSTSGYNGLIEVVIGDVPSCEF